MDPTFGHGKWAALSATSGAREEVFQRFLIADSDTPSQHAKVTSGGAVFVSGGGGFGGAASTEGALSAQFPTYWSNSESISAIAYELSATSAVVPASAGFRTLIIGIKAIAYASAGFHRWAVSGAALSAIEGYVPVDAFGGYIDRCSPPWPLYEISAGAAFILQASSLVSAVAGSVRYWRKA